MIDQNKIIFLDLDGVLNAFDYSYMLSEMRNMEAESKGESYKGELQNKTKDMFGSLFDPRCCSWLKYIIENTGARIVISSTWRREGLEEMKKLWDYRKLPGEVVGITPFCYNVKTAYTGTKFERYRGVEIEQYVKQHAVKSYCIIDDEPKIIPYQKFYLCQTPSEFGITMDVAERAIDILNQND